MVIDALKGFDEDVPKWDIALAAFVKEEAEKLGRGLRIADVKRLAGDHEIRFDDIMVTLFELVINKEWRYEYPDGVGKVISREEVEKQYVSGRLVEADVNEYVGLWLPT